MTFLLFLLAHLAVSLLQAVLPACWPSSYARSTASSESGKRDFLMQFLSSCSFKCCLVQSVQNIITSLDAKQLCSSANPYARSLLRYVVSIDSTKLSRARGKLLGDLNLSVRPWKGKMFLSAKLRHLINKMNLDQSQCEFFFR